MISDVLSSDTNARAASTGPSFAAALCGFLCTTLATTMLLVLLGTL